MWLKKYWSFDAAFTAGALFILLVFINIGRLRPLVEPLHPILVIGVAAVILLTGRSLRSEGAVSLGGAGYCWLGLVFFAFVSSVTAPPGADRGVWDRDTHRLALRGAVDCIKYLGAYFIAYNMITSTRTLKGVYRVFLLALAGMLYFAFKQILFGEGRRSLFVGPFYGPNETGMGMAMFLPFFLKLAVLPAGKFRWKWLFLAMAVLCTLVLFYTVSRSALLSLGAVLIWWAISERRKLLALTIAMALAGMMAIMSLIVYMSPQGFTDTSYVARVQTVLKGKPGQGRDPNVQGRIDYWVESLRIWKKYPLLGIGRDCFSEHTMNEGFLVQRSVGLDPQTAVHSNLLHVLVEQGLVGFLLYLGLLITLYRNLARARRMPGMDPFLKAMVEATSLGFLAWFVSGLFLSEQYNWCFVLFTGFAAGARRVADNMARQGAPLPSPLPAAEKPAPVRAEAALRPCPSTGSGPRSELAQGPP